MFGQIFSNRVVRKYVIFFGHLFDDVYLTRDKADGSREQTMKVPLNYGPKEKFLARLRGNPDLDREIALQLPRMSFEMVDMFYDSTRKLASTRRIICDDEDGTQSYQYVPVPYNFVFELSIMTKNLEDRYRIIESILPFFNPEFTGSLNLAGNKYDIPVILNSTENQDNYEGQFTERRALISTLRFTMKGYVFGPTRSGSLITQAEVNIRIPEEFATANSSTDPSVEITVTPGLNANGEPTTDPSQTIDRNSIGPDDNYAFIVDIEENL